MVSKHIGNKDTKGSALLVGIIGIVVVLVAGGLLIRQRSELMQAGLPPVPTPEDVLMDESEIGSELEFLEDALLEEVPTEFAEEPGTLVERDFSNVADVIEQDGAITYQGERLAGTISPVIEFNEADYAAARQSGKNILLYFYASWCPVCNNEVSTALYPAFNALQNPNVIAFRVNFNDSSTSAVEEDLAKQFAVTYQHTKVLLRNGSENVLKSFEAWDQDRYLEEMDMLFTD